MTEKISPMPPKQALIRLIRQRVKIGVLTKRVFIDKGLNPIHNAIPEKKNSRLLRLEQ
jgi:hypothetical protein